MGGQWLAWTKVWKFILDQFAEAGINHITNICLRISISWANKSEPKSDVTFIYGFSRIHAKKRIGDLTSSCTVHVIFALYFKFRFINALVAYVERLLNMYVFFLKSIWVRKYTKSWWSYLLIFFEQLNCNPSSSACLVPDLLRCLLLLWRRT